MENFSFNVDGHRIPGVLQKLSPTGGLACPAQLIEEGTLAEIMLDTREGPVTALVEILRPAGKGIPSTQPFRFVALSDDQNNRLNIVLECMRKQGLGDKAGS